MGGSRLAFAAAYLLLTGLGLLIAKSIVLLPLLRWLKARSEADLDLVLQLGAKTLVATGLALFLLAALRQAREHRP